MTRKVVVKSTSGGAGCVVAVAGVALCANACHSPILDWLRRVRAIALLVVRTVRRVVMGRQEQGSVGLSFLQSQGCLDVSGFGRALHAVFYKDAEASIVLLTVARERSVRAARQRAR